VLIGRERECVRIDELIERARMGKSGALVLRGEAGIGKTALLDYAAGRATEMTVVRTVGVESEAELEFAALLDVCRPLLGHAAELTERQADTLRAALGVGPAVSLERFEVGAATLGLFAAAAETRPLLVVVDDAQWVDPSSADALLFATRRLDADRILTLFAARDDGEAHFDAPAIESIQVQGLSRDAAVDLLRARIEVVPDVAERLHAATEGNPLALMELPGVLTPEQLLGAAPLDDPLPAGSTVEQAFGRRAAALSDVSRSALLVAAVSWSSALATILPALELLGLEPRALEAAEDAGLVSFADATLVFRHPLVRSAVFHAAAASERRAAHRALAAASGGTASDEGAWHLAAAALGPDEDVASALAGVASRAELRNAHAEAAAAFERAARLTPDPRRRANRFLSAAEAAWVVADAARTLGLVEAAAEAGPDEADRSRALQLRGAIERRIGTQSGARDLFLEVEQAIAPSDLPALADALVAAGSASFFAGDLAGAVEIARRLRRLAPRDRSELDGRADTVLGWLLAEAGGWQEAAPILERAVELLLAAGEPSMRQLHNAAVALGLLERPGEADELLVRASRLARASGPRSVLQSLDQLTLANVQCGRWDQAVAGGQEATLLAAQLGDSENTNITIQLARVAAARGEEDACRERVAECAQLAREHGVVTTGAAADAVLGLLELGAGRMGEAIARLGAAARDVERLGLYDRETSPHPDLVEALLRAGRRDDALDALDRYEERAAAGTPVWGGALVARGRGILAEDDDVAAGHFEDALELHARVEDRFQHARTLLAFGERLRRAGLRREARERLRAAHGLFEELCATPWRLRTEQELRASGAKLRKAVESGDDLTPQELQIALQVAEGKANKEVAAAMFLSTKTVEFHLSRIYRKLGLTSRAELVRRFATGVEVQAAGSPAR
jgi:DNA-binding CsgD family transcriptional regulator